MHQTCSDRCPSSTNGTAAAPRAGGRLLRELSPRFEGLYARAGRPSIAPEQLRAQLLQILYTIRSERQLLEQLDYNLLFRWFVGLNMDELVWDPTVFTKNRQRLLDGEVATAFLERVVALAQQRRLLSGEQASARDRPLLGVRARGGSVTSPVSTSSPCTSDASARARSSCAPRPTEAGRQESGHPSSSRTRDHVSSDVRLDRPGSDAAGW